jgi:hypothetical protein
MHHPTTDPHIHRRVMEVTQRLQPIQYKAYQLFTEVEGRGEELE